MTWMEGKGNKVLIMYKITFFDIITLLNQK